MAANPRWLLIQDGCQSMMMETKTRKWNAKAHQKAAALNHCLAGIGEENQKTLYKIIWLTLTHRRYSRRLFYYKIQNNLTPAYLKDPLPPLINHQHGTRSENVFQELKCNTESYRSSFYRDGVRCWNRIGQLLRNAPNLQQFKCRILAGYRSTPKSIFGIHDPLGTKRLFQLRVGLSPLLEHTKKHNFLDTPSNICTICKSPENTEHFFLHCARFTEARYTFLNTIHLLNRNFHLLVPEEKSLFLLYGDKSLAIDINKLVLKATLKYLKDTERFA